MKKSLALVLIIIVLAFLAGCQPTPTGEAVKTDFSTDVVNITLPPAVDKAAEQASSTAASDAIPPDSVVVNAVEGDLVHLKPEATDPDKDPISYVFTKPFNENGKWQTKEGDAGKYLVTITATDGKLSTTQDVIVIIGKAKQPPVIECPDSISVKEGEKISLNCNIYDPEGDSAIVEYSGFMKGATYQTTFTDAGEYTTVIKARNKYKEATKTVKISVRDVNRAPTITGVPETLKAMENDIITLTPDVVDPDKDKVTVTYSKPFDSKGVWKTQVGDAGVLKASIVATDGKLTTKKEVSITVDMINTAPVLKKIADITVSEGDTVKLPIEASDRECDKLKVTVTGWMTGETYTTTYDDAGNYSVVITVSDGTFQAKQTVHIEVLNKNRPPVFKVPA